MVEYTSTYPKKKAYRNPELEEMTPIQKNTTKLIMKKIRLTDHKNVLNLTTSHTSCDRSTPLKVLLFLSESHSHIIPKQQACHNSPFVPKRRIDHNCRNHFRWNNSWCMPWRNILHLYAICCKVYLNLMHVAESNLLLLDNS